MKTRTKKATFNLSEEILEALDDAMARGAAPSKNALVQNAIEKELKELKKQETRVRWQKAAKDPLFLRDMQRVESDFHYADNDLSVEK